RRRHAAGRRHHGALGPSRGARDPEGGGMTASAWDVIVIGAGANGLVAATRLARAGLRTLVLERSDAVGGQGRVVEFAPGFSAAPLGLDPGWLPPSVARAAGIDGVE